MGPSCSSPRTASSMVSARRAMRPIVAIYLRVANRRPVGMLDEDHARVVLGPCDRRPYPDEDLDHPSSPRSSTTVSGKRRAAGPAVKKTATKPARRPRSGKERVRLVAKWAAIVGLVGLLLATAGFVVLYRSIDIPDP